ncbi:MAG: aldo/keto reductase [Spirochaetales bacterium]|nr:aldo/keto reductase [Spirochaetales bacterium]
MQKTLTLSNGYAIPILGFGTFQIPDGEVTTTAVKAAIQTGYRHIDCAAIYGNEKAVGQGIAESGVPREELFITSKLWNDRDTPELALEAFEQTLSDLGTDYLDLYLIHWPKKHSTACWNVLEQLYTEGRAKAIGVCNYTIRQLEELFKAAHLRPMVNQVELHPLWPQDELVNFCHTHGIHVESWGPLMQGRIFTMPLFAEMAQKHGCTVAQLAIAWQVNRGLIALAKSSSPERIAANLAVPNIVFDAGDEKRIADLAHERFGPDPENFDF